MNLLLVREDLRAERFFHNTAIAVARC